MFEICERSVRTGEGTVQAYRTISPASLGHLVDGCALDRGITSLAPDVYVVGTALTVRTLGRDSTICHKAIEFVEPGDVIVIDRGGDETYACWGEMMSLAAKLRGAAGVVIDGPVTDVREIRELGLPVFARGTSALTTQLLGQGGAINIPVMCGGVEVCPGDLILGDDNGVLVLGPDEADRLLSAARAEEEGDGEYRRDLLSGRLPSELAPIDEMIRRANDGR